jgi:hypothetical protein
MATWKPFGTWDYFVFPAANHLRADADWTLLTKYLKQQRAPLVVLGLGAQAEHGADPARAARELRANASVVEFVDTLRSQAVLITVRGPFSEAVCHEMSLTNVVRLGCPSQFLHADPALGQTLRARMDAIANSASPARIAITASAPNELHGWRRDAETRLVSWLPAAPGLYVQQSCDDALFDGQTGRLNPAEASDLARLFSGMGAPNNRGRRGKRRLSETSASILTRGPGSKSWPTLILRSVRASMATWRRLRQPSRGS